MAAGTYHITAEKNQALIVDVVYKDDTDATVDLSGSTITIYVKDNASDAAPALTKDLTTEPNADLANGKFVINLTAAEIAAFDFDQGIYYIDLTGSPALRLLEGKLQISNNSAY
jgi:hypothetical protein